MSAKSISSVFILFRALQERLTSVDKVHVFRSLQNLLFVIKKGHARVDWKVHAKQQLHGTLTFSPNQYYA